MFISQGLLGNKYIAGVVGILLALVIAYNVQFFMTRSKPTTPAKPTHRQMPAGREPADGSVQTHSALVTRPADKGIDKTPWKRDPFSLRQAVTDIKPDDIRLMGIIKRTDNSLALINGKVYKVNDRIGTAVIREIKQHSIVVLARNKKQEITFDDYKVIEEKKK